jgi:hypothetical protein
VITHPWRIRVTDWNGIEVYYGPPPVPDELITLTLEDFADGRMFTFEVDTSRLSLN